MLWLRSASNQPEIDEKTNLLRVCPTGGTVKHKLHSLQMGKVVASTAASMATFATFDNNDITCAVKGAYIEKDCTYAEQKPAGGHCRRLSARWWLIDGVAHQPEEVWRQQCFLLQDL